MLGSASDGSPHAEGLSTGTASGTASGGAIAGRGAAAGDAAPVLHLVRPTGEAQAGIGANRDGSPESKWAAAAGGSPLREANGPSLLAPPIWRASSVADSVTGGGVAGRPVGLPPRPSDLPRTSSQDLQTARSMSVDASTPRANAAAQPPLDPLQHRLQTPEQREHAHRTRGGAGGGPHHAAAVQGGMWTPHHPQARLTAKPAVEMAHIFLHAPLLMLSVVGMALRASHLRISRTGADP